MNTLIERLNVIAHSLIAWASLAIVVLAAALDWLIPALGADSGVVVFIAQVVAALGVGVAALRRVTPVPDDQVGILPPTTS